MEMDKRTNYAQKLWHVPTFPCVARAMRPVLFPVFLPFCRRTCHLLSPADWQLTRELAHNCSGCKQVQMRISFCRINKNLLRILHKLDGSMTSEGQCLYNCYIHQTKTWCVLIPSNLDNHALWHNYNGRNSVYFCEGGGTLSYITVNVSCPSPLQDFKDCGYCSETNLQSVW